MRMRILGCGLIVSKCGMGEGQLLRGGGVEP